MANTIKLKRGTSTPSTSDISSGEVAIDTSAKKLYVNDSGTIKEIGGGISDGDKGDITVASSGTSWTIDAGAIDNANINSSAAIAGTKISPDFGSQDIATTGKLSITSTFPRIDLTDSNNNPDWSIINNNGILGFYDDTNSAYRLNIQADGHVDVGHLDVGNALDVTGNITVSGTVDGVDIATRDGTAARKDGSDMGTATLRTDDADFIVQDSTDGTTNFIWRDHSASKLYLGTDAAVVTPRSHVIPQVDSTYNLGSNGTRWAYIYGDTISGNLYGNGANITVLNASQLTSGTVAAARLDTATTQSAGNNSTKIATTAYTDTAISNLVDSAPGTLNTLNELAAALGDDANFSTTVTNSIATKLPLAGGTLTGDTTLANTKKVIFNASSGAGAFIKHQSGHFEIISSVGNTYFASAGTLYLRTNGSTNALTLDTSQNATFAGTATATGLNLNDTNTALSEGSTNTLRITTDSGYVDIGPKNTSWCHFHTDRDSFYFAQKVSWNGNILPYGDSAHDIGSNGTRWANIYGDTLHGDGANVTNVNATTLDSIDSGSFLRSDVSDTFSGANLTLSHGNNSYPLTIHGGDNAKILLSDSSNPYIRWREGSTDKAYIQWNSSGFLGLYNQEDASSLLIKDDITFSVDGSTYHKVFHAGNDGSGSGLDADTLDGVQGASYLRSDATDSASGAITFTSGSLQISPHYYQGYYSGTTNYIHLYPFGTSSGNASVTNIRAWNGSDADVFQITGGSSTGLKWRGHTIWTGENDGAGSYLDADLLDGQEGSYYRNASNLNAGTVGTARLGSGTASSSTYLRGDGSWASVSATDSSKIPLTGGTFTGQLTWGGQTTAQALDLATGDGYGSLRVIRNNKSSGGDGMYIGYNNSNNGITRIYGGGGSSLGLQVDGSGVSDVYIAGNIAFNAGNDGAGSGLDADKLDGVQADKFFTSYNNAGTTGWQNSNGNFRINTGSTAAGLAMHESDGTFAFQLYGNGTSYGFLDANWGNWDIRKYINGDLYVDAGSGLKLVTTQDSNPTFGDVYASDWFRNNSSTEGMYNQATTQHFYSDNDDYWNVGGGSGANGIRLRDEHGGTIRGYLYADNSSNCGVLTAAGQWGVKCVSGAHVSLYHSGSQKFYTQSDKCVVAGHFYPESNNSYDLGHSSYRWRHIYTGDLSLSNEGASNDVDGTWGSFTIQEGENDLFLFNKRNGKKYKFNLTEVS